MFFISPFRPRRLRILALLALIHLAGPGAGSAGVVVYSTSSVENISATASSTAFTNTLVCDWNVQCAQADNTVVTWVATPFQHPTTDQYKLDSQLQLIALDTAGPTTAVVVQRTSSTVNGGKALVSAVVSGTGVARFRVIISTVGDNESRLAGLYTTSVYAVANSK